MRRAQIGLALVGLLVLALPAIASAHPLRFGVLRAEEIDPGRVEVILTFSGTEADPRSASFVVPDECRESVPGRVESLPRGVRERRTLQCDQGLSGLPIHVEGLGQPGRGDSQVHVIAVPYGSGPIEHTLDASAPRWTVSGPVGPDGLSASMTLGVTHVLTGFDHLAFLLALVWLVLLGSTISRAPERSPARSEARRLAARLATTVTAFTIGHSLTLALAAFGLLVLPAAPVEALIAASLVFLAVPLARGADAELPLARRPEIAALGFGLVHGLGFASVLVDSAIDTDRLASILFGFNVGVEVGQLTFVVVATAVLLAVRAVRLDGHARRVAGYLVGAGGVFLFIGRLLVMM